MTLLSDRLRTAREKKNLTQVQVKARTGIHNKTLSGYENGVSEPDLETLKTLASLYEVSVDWLTGLSNKSRQNTDTSVPPEQADFLKWVEENLEGTFFYDFHKSPEEQKEEMMETLRMVWELEKKKKARRENKE